MGASLYRRLHKSTLAALLVSIPGLARGQGSEPAASVDFRDSCLAGHEQSQELKLQGKLLDSKKALLSCTEEQCPSIVRADCVKWLDDVEAAIPTIVIVAVSDKGDEIDVNLAIDGKFTTNKLDGKPIELDPGIHVIDFALPGSRPQKLTLNVGQGEKNRIVRLDFRTKVSPLAPAPLASAQAQQPHAPESWPLLSYVLGGVALAGLGSATYFGVSALVAHNDARNCEPLCSRAAADDVRRKALYADLSLSISVLSAAGVLFVNANNRCSASTNASKQPREGLAVRGFGFSATAGGGLTSIGGVF